GNVRHGSFVHTDRGSVPASLLCYTGNLPLVSREGKGQCSRPLRGLGGGIRRGAPTAGERKPPAMPSAGGAGRRRVDVGVEGNTSCVAPGGAFPPFRRL